MRQAWFQSTIATVWGLLFLIIPSHAAAPSSLGRVAGTPSNPQELLNIIRDTTLPFKDRVDLVTAVLDHQPDQAPAWLMRELSAPSGTASLRPILKALSTRRSRQLQAFQKALFPLLETEDDLVKPLVIQAFSRIDNPATLRRLSEIARRQDATPRLRRSAISALAYHPQRDVIDTLLVLIQDENPHVRASAYAALRGLTGQEDLPDDPTPWSRWWREQSNLSLLKWQQSMLQSLANRGRRGTLRQQQLESRLCETLQLLYLSSESEQRTELLIVWMEDPLRAIRELAMDLVAQRLVDVGAQPVRDSLRVALRNGLQAADPAMRRRAADALRQLGDTGAATIVAINLAANTEHNSDVLAAYLRLVRHMPQRQAIAPMIKILGNPHLTRVAADAITAALDVEDNASPWITEQQAATIRNEARRHLDVVNDETPSMIRLLGRIATPQSLEDWQIIAGFLDSSIDLAKDAAARAWAESDQPLKPLATRASDEVIQPFLYDAAIQRGKDNLTFIAVADHPPARPSLAPNWEQAMVALAGRVAPGSVLQVTENILPVGKHLELRINLLSAAIVTLEAPMSGHKAVDENRGHTFMTLLLSRGKALIDVGQSRRALADYERIRTDTTLAATPWQRATARIGSLQAMLNTAQVATALTLAKQMLKESNPDHDPYTDLLPLLVDAAHRTADAEKSEDAHIIYSFLLETVSRDRLAPYADAIHHLEAKLKSSTPRDDAADMNAADEP